MNPIDLHIVMDMPPRPAHGHALHDITSFHSLFLQRKDSGQELPGTIHLNDYLPKPLHALLRPTFLLHLPSLEEVLQYPRQYQAMVDMLVAVRSLTPLQIPVGLMIGGEVYRDGLNAFFQHLWDFLKLMEGFRNSTMPIHFTFDDELEPLWLETTAKLNPTTHFVFGQVIQPPSSLESLQAFEDDVRNHPQAIQLRCASAPLWKPELLKEVLDIVSGREYPTIFHVNRTMGYYRLRTLFLAFFGKKAGMGVHVGFRELLMLSHMLTKLETDPVVLKHVGTISPATSIGSMLQ